MENWGNKRRPSQRVNKLNQHYNYHIMSTIRYCSQNKTNGGEPHVSQLHPLRCPVQLYSHLNCNHKDSKLLASYLLRYSRW